MKTAGEPCGVSTKKSIAPCWAKKSLFGAFVRIFLWNKTHPQKIPHSEKTQRRRRGNKPFLKQPIQGLAPQLADPSLASALFLESMPPILLRLTVDLPKPSISRDLLFQALDDDCCQMAEPSPENFRSQRMNPAAIRAPVTLHPKRFRKSLEIPFHIPVAPQPPAPTLWTLRWPRPWIILFLFMNFLDRKLKLDYHMSVVLIVSGSRDAKLLKPFEPEEGLQTFLRLFFLERSGLL